LFKFVILKSNTIETLINRNFTSPSTQTIVVRNGDFVYTKALSYQRKKGLFCENRLTGFLLNQYKSHQK
jgi:hypothetical protein